MERSNLSYLKHEVVKRTVLANWADYLLEHFDTLVATLNQAVLSIGDELSIVIAVDPKDLSLHEVGLMIGDARPSLFTSDKIWWLQVPILDASNPDCLRDIEVLVDLTVQAWLPIDCGKECSR